MFSSGKKVSLVELLSEDADLAGAVAFARLNKALTNRKYGVDVSPRVRKQETKRPAKPKKPKRPKKKKIKLFLPVKGRAISIKKKKTRKRK